MDQAVDALMGAAYGSAGERRMAISVAVPIGDTTAERLIEKLVPKVRALNIGPGTDPDAEMGPLVTNSISKRFVVTSTLKPPATQSDAEPNSRRLTRSGATFRSIGLSENIRPLPRSEVPPQLELSCHGQHEGAKRVRRP
jgi:hypothetical protein